MLRPRTRSARPAQPTPGRPRRVPRLLLCRQPHALSADHVERALAALAPVALAAGVRDIAPRLGVDPALAPLHHVELAVRADLADVDGLPGVVVFLVHLVLADRAVD